MNTATLFLFLAALSFLNRKNGLTLLFALLAWWAA